MARSKSPIPSCRFHLSGQAVVEIEGISFYLGQQGSHESYARCTATLRIYQGNNLSLPEGFSPKVFREIYEASQTTGGQLTAVNVSQIVTLGILVEAYSDYFRKRFGQKYQVQELDRKLSAMKWLEPAHKVDVSKFGLFVWNETGNGLNSETRLFPEVMPSSHPFVNANGESPWQMQKTKPA